VKFDEVTIAEHDKDRGTRTKITEPKTPYEVSEGGAAVEEEVHPSATGDVEMHSPKSHVVHTEIDEQIKHHLEEAERNKLLNA